MYRFAREDVVKSRANMPTQEQQMARMDEFRALAEKLLEEGKAKKASGQMYTIDDYYSHLLQIDRKREELGEFPVSMPFYPEQELQELLRDWGARGFNEADQDKAFAWFKARSPRFRTEPPEVTKSREHVFAKLRSGGYNSWAVSQYLSNMVLACFLFLIWACEGEERKKYWTLPSPLHFIVALVFYPLVIAYVCWRWLQETRREWWAEAEMRRTKEKLFAPLSQVDLERLQRFLKSRAHISVWRQELQQRGLRPRHSLAAALFATALLMVVGLGDRGSFAQTLPLGAEVAAQALGVHLPRASLGDGSSLAPDTGTGGFHPETGQDCVLVDSILPPRFSVHLMPGRDARVKPRRVAADIGHVPRSGMVLGIARAITNHTHYEEAANASSCQGGSHVSVVCHPDLGPVPVLRRRRLRGHAWQAGRRDPHHRQERCGSARGWEAVRPANHDHVLVLRPAGIGF